MISAPRLSGYDDLKTEIPIKAAAEPLCRLLREPKRLELYDGGHVPQLEVAVPVINRWLDETLGTVRYN
ncbi:MAG TPA: hypothetical protein VJ810_13820 [Blastocatellia bacterium]|nr:hypothetical protein [Blastocatellia bacterium]